MDKERIKDWIKVFETPEFLAAGLIEARLRDQNIEFYTLNNTDIGFTIGYGQNPNYNSGIPIKIFVKIKDREKALEVINEDRSELVEGEDLDFGKSIDEIEEDKE